MSGANLLLWLAGAQGGGGGGGGDSACYTSGTATITTPAGKTGVVIKAFGGGGAGGSQAAGAGGGGGGGAYVVKTVAVTGGVTTFTYSIGAQTGTTALNSNGADGNNTTVTGGASITAGGGKGGLADGTPGAGGVATGGDTGSENGSAGSGATGGDAGGQSEGGGTGGVASGEAGTVSGGGGAGGQNDIGGRGARGQVCFYWIADNVNLTAQSARSWGYDNTQGICEFKLGSDGVAYIADEIGVLNPIAGEWLISGTASDYEVRATQNLTTGVPPGAVSGTFGTWQSLGTDRSWFVEVTNPGIGTLNAQLFMTIEIRDASTLTVLATAAITLWASSTDSNPP